MGGELLIHGVVCCIQGLRYVRNNSAWLLGSKGPALALRRQPLINMI